MRKVPILIMELLCADDAALANHSEADVQRLINRFAAACREFGLTINLKKKEVVSHDVSKALSISIGDHTLEVLEKFTYHWSTICNNLSLDPELNFRIGNATIAMACLTKKIL